MIERIKNIFYRPEFFRDQRFGTNQALSFYSLVILAYVIPTLFTLLPGASAIIQSMRSGEWQTQRGIVAGLYPEDLKLTVNRDTVTTNQSGPVIIALPESWRVAAECGSHRCVQNELPTNLLVIDTDRPINRADFMAFDTVAILGAQEIGFHNPARGETRIFNLKEANFKESFTLTASLFRDGVDKGFKALQIGFFVLLFIVPAVMYVGLWMGYLVYSLFGALVVWVAVNVRGHTLRYSQAYRSALYLLPAPLMLSFLLSLGNIHIPFVFTLVLFAMALVNFAKPVGSEPVEGSEKLPDPVKIATTDTLVVPKDTDVEAKPYEETK